MFQNSSQNILLLDGAMGTELESRGCDVNHPLWSTHILLNQSEQVRAVHLSHIEAGSDIISSCTYQMSVETLLARQENEKEEEQKKEEKEKEKQESNKWNIVAQVVGKALSVASQSREEEKKGGEEKRRGKVLIAGSIGSVGSSLPNGKEYSGEYPQENSNEEYFRNFHKDRLVALIASPSSKACDCLLIETQPRLDEVLCILQMIREFFSFLCDRQEDEENVSMKKGRKKIPVLVSFVLQTQQQRQQRQQEENVTSFKTGFGDDLKVAFERIMFEFSDLVVGIGINCVSPRVIVPVYQHVFLPLFSDNNNVAFVCYPNSGEIYDGETKTWKQQGEEEKQQQQPESSQSLTKQQENYDWLQDLLKIRKFAPNQQRLIIGGCCRTSANEIAAFRKIIDANSEK